MPFKQKINSKKILSWLVIFSIACGPGPLEMGEFFSLFYPQTASIPTRTDAYFFSPNFLNEDTYFAEQNSTSLADSLNCLAWSEITLAKISYSEFKAALISNENREKLIADLKNNNQESAAEYLELAFKIEAATPAPVAYWETPEKPDIELLNTLYSEIIQKLSTKKSDFITERYAFQAIKLDMMTEKYEQAIADYEKYILPVSEKSMIADWARSRMAAAWLKKGDKARAVYQWAQVFHDCPTRRREADLSIRRLEFSDTDKALQFCKNDQEKVALYALLAIQPGKDGLDLMKKIYEIEPENPMLQLVMTREINKNEMDFFAANQFWPYDVKADILNDDYEIDSDKVDKLRQTTSAYFEQLLTFNQTIISQNKTADQAFWQISAAYLNLLVNRFDETDKLLKEAKKSTQLNDYRSRQITFLDAVLDINKLDPQKEKEKDQLFEQLLQLKNLDQFREFSITKYLSSKLTQKLSSGEISEQVKPSGGWLSACTSSKSEISTQKDSIRAFLAQNMEYQAIDEGYGYGYGRGDLIDKTSTDLLKRVIAFTEKKKLSGSDKKLIQLSGLNSDFLNLECARKLNSNYQFQDANTYLQKVNPIVFKNENFDSYFENIPDQIPGSEKRSEDVLSYMKRLSDLELKTNKGSKNPEDWYQMAEMSYNLGWFGNAWILAKREWSTYDLDYNKNFPAGYFNGENALEMLKKALSLNPDKELGARIIYLAALCERNQFYYKYRNQDEPYDEAELIKYRAEMRVKRKPFQQYFQLLHDKYADTEYEKMVIQECLTYRLYLEDK